MDKLIDHVGGQVHFRFFRDGSLWYETESHMVFPVPVSDVGTATFNRDDKAILFMRWIRKFAGELANARSESFDPEIVADINAKIGNRYSE